MKLHDASSIAHNTFNGYGDGHYVVNGVTYRTSTIVTPREIRTNWTACTVATLDAAALDTLTQLGASIVLLGSGTRQRFPAPAVLRELASRGIAVEVMDNSAACRTFNILAAEGRDVAAALLLSEGRA